MSELAPVDPVSLLARLTDHQMSILQMVCAGLEYKEIAKDKFVSINTVKSNMGHIYQKLGLTELHSTKRRKRLFEVVCPAISKGVVIPAEQEEEIDRLAVPANVIRQVEEDEKAIIEWKQQPLLPLRGRVVTPPRPLGWLAVGLLLGGLLMYVVLSRILPPQTIIQTAVPLTPLFEVPEATRIVTTTPEPSQSTAEPVVIVVTATEIPITSTTEVIAIQPSGFVFSDDFEDGLDLLWLTHYGELGMANGKMTITEPYTDRHTRHLNILEGMNWQNVRVNFELAAFDNIFVSSSDNATGAIVFGFGVDQSPVGLFISPGDIGVQFGILDTEGMWTPHAGSLVDGDQGNFDFSDSPSEFVIEVVDSTFRVFVNSNLVTSAAFPDLAPGEIGFWFEAGTFNDKVDIYSARIEFITIEALP